MATRHTTIAVHSFDQLLTSLVDSMHIHSAEPVGNDSPEPWEWYREKLDESFDEFVASIFPQGSPEALALSEYERGLADATGNLSEFYRSQKRSNYPEVIRNNELIQRALDARQLALKLIEMHVADPNLIKTAPRNWALASERKLVDDLDDAARWFVEYATSTNQPANRGTPEIGADKESNNASGPVAEWSDIESPKYWQKRLHWSSSKWTKTVKAEPDNFRHDLTAEGKKNFQRVAIRNSHLSRIEGRNDTT